jgi:D-serine deaminase-like pyridoxal phosphate-dependent protein
VRQTKALLADDGIVVERVSGGGTPVMWQAHNHQEVTEHRAGTYIYGDRGMVNAGALQWEDCALRVIATVVSRPTADRGILDSGSKSLSADLFGLAGHGYIVEYPQARLYGLSEEHGHVDFANCPTKPQIGERVSIIPNHCCLVTNLFNEIVAMRNNEVEVIWPVAARGHVQ